MLHRNSVSNYIGTMNQLLVIFLLGFSALKSASLNQPRGLVDEAREQLEQLKSIVQGDIMVAHDDLDNLVNEFRIHEVNVANDASLAIDQQQETADSRADTMLDLAAGAGFNVTSCANFREQRLNSLNDQYKKQIASCMQTIDGEAFKTARDAKYVVDINMSKVHDLQNQFNRCNDDLLCISPLLTEIELNKIRMPQNIKTEVQVTESLLTTMRPSVQSCADSNLARYAAEIFLILRDIQYCLDILTCCI